MRRKPRWLPRRELVRSLPRTGVDGCARARVANEPGARRAETRPTPTPARERRRRNVCSRSMFARDALAREHRSRDVRECRALGVALGVRRRVGCCVGRCVPPDCLRIRPTDRTLDENNRECRFSPATRRRPPLVDARGTRRESRDAIKNIIIARARRSSFVDVIARARSPAPARVVDRARFRSSSRRRLRRLSCCARSVVVVVQPISRDS